MRTIGLYKKTENFRYQAERLDVDETKSPCISW